MRIMLVNTFYHPDIIGGAEVSVQKLAEGLVKNGHEVYVLCTGLKDSIEVSQGVNIVRFKVNNLYQPIEFRQQPSYKKVLYRLVDLCNIFNYKKLKRIIKEINPDVLHVNNIYGISPIIWILGSKMKIPVIQTVRDYYLLQPLGSYNGRIPGDLYSKAHRFIMRKLSNNVNYITSPSATTLNIFLKNYFFKKINNEVIHNAIDIEKKVLDRVYTNRLLNKKVKGSNLKYLKYLYVGTLDRHKGVDILLEGFKSLKNHNIELHIAGKGPLAAKIEGLNDKRVVFHGFLNEEELSTLMLSCDILVAPSTWIEPFGRVILDAYKHGLPVIVSDVGGLSEIVDKDSGIKIKNIDSVKIAQALNYFVDSPEQIAKYIKGTRSKIGDFTIDKQVEKFLHVYKDCLLERDEEIIYENFN